MREQVRAQHVAVDDRGKQRQAGEERGEGARGCQDTLANRAQNPGKQQLQNEAAKQRQDREGRSHRRGRRSAACQRRKDADLRIRPKRRIEPLQAARIVTVNQNEGQTRALAIRHDPAGELRPVPGDEIAAGGRPGSRPGDATPLRRYASHYAARRNRKASRIRHSQQSSGASWRQAIPMCGYTASVRTRDFRRRSTSVRPGTNMITSDRRSHPDLGLCLIA